MSTVGKNDQGIDNYLDVEDWPADKVVLIKDLYKLIRHVIGLGAGGGGGTSITNGSGAPSGGSDGDYYIDYDAGSIYYKSAGTWGTILESLIKSIYDPAGLAAQINVIDIAENVNGLMTRLANQATPGQIVPGQKYLADNGGILQLPSGISYVRVTGTYITAGAKGFSNVAEAWVTALGKFVPCDYDVFSNELSLNTLTKKVSFTAAQIKNGNTVPLVLLPAIPDMIACIETLNAIYYPNSEAFDNAYDLNIYYNGTGQTLFKSILFFSPVAPANSCVFKSLTESLVQDTFIPEQSIICFMDGDSTTGDGTIDFYLTYKYVII